MDINAQKCLSNGSLPGLGFKVDADRKFYIDPEAAACQADYDGSGVKRIVPPRLSRGFFICGQSPMLLASP